MKRGDGKSFSHAEGGGHKKFWGSFYVVARGGAKSFHSLKEGAHEKFYPALRAGGGAQNVSDLRFSHFVAPTSL